MRASFPSNQPRRSMADFTADIDYSDDIARLEKHRGYTVLPPRRETNYLTLHYSGVGNTDRSHTAELNRILNEARYQLHHDYSGNGSGAYPDGLLYDCVILSDGTCVRTRAHPQQLWHVGNTLGNAESFSLHLMLGPGQDATPTQWQRVLRVMDEVRDHYTFPVAHIVGHCEWPRRKGAPRPSTSYQLLPEQSECPGRVLHARLAYSRAAASIAPIVAYTEHSALIGVPHATPGQAVAYILSRPHTNYTDDDVRNTIVPAYYATCRGVGVDPVLAIAQMIHETGNLTSAKSRRPWRNPAGIGATNDGAQGVGFASWKDDAVPAQIGRLLAYALPAGTGTPQQLALIEKALTYRGLPAACRGSAPILRFLGSGPNPVRGCGWAGKDDSEGMVYGAKIAEIANAIARQ